MLIVSSSVIQYFLLYLYYQHCEEQMIKIKIYLNRVNKSILIMLPTKITNFPR